MNRKLLLYCAGALGCALPIGCADYPESREQRPVYSYENVEMGPADSGQEYRNDVTEHRDPYRRR
ncbi:MAG TPA: hypothetical protein VF019_01295 [Nitrospira sp.]